jgi:dTDP-glucose pyrophosphorylase
VIWRSVCVNSQTPLRETIARIDKSRLQIGLVTDDVGRLIGIVTDGDLRRAMLKGIGLEVATSTVMNTKPRVLPAGTTKEDIVAFMRRHVLHQVPLVNEGGLLVGLEVLDALLGAFHRPNWIVLMAGGLGSRLSPLTDDCPKPMLAVGGKPILENIIESFIEQGFRHFFISVNYKAEQIKNYFGNGERWGITVDYLHEDKRLGTAGALSLLPKQPTDPLIVMNGDLLTRANFQGIVDFHLEQVSFATMAVREYDIQVPFGVVTLDGDRISNFIEKPVQSFFVNAGIYVISPYALTLIPKDTFFDMPTLFGMIAREQKKTTAFPLHEYWVDIGRLEEFHRAEREWILQGRGR